MAAPNSQSLVEREDVQRALAAAEGPAAKLISFQWKNFTSKGDNYACLVSSVEVMFEKDGQEQKTSYVVKLNQPNPVPALEKMSAIMFEKEIGFYKEIIPLLNKELEALQFSPLGVPKYFYSETQKEKDVIFMEDMRERDFKMLDRRIGMDRNHTMLVMRELAKLHAISVILMDTNKFKRENLERKFSFLEEAFTKTIEEGLGKNSFLNFFGNAFSIITEVVEKMNGYECEAKFLRSIVPTSSDTMINILKPEKPFVTICHGDSWNNNFLFRLVKNTINSIYFISCISFSSCKSSFFVA